MIKKILALTVAVLMLFLVGCKKDEIDLMSSEPDDVSSEVVPVNKNKVNPLTGIQDLDPSLFDRRPAAIMINNTSVAQPVQTGVGKADIVYETEVEGGVTRLLAVFKNIEAASQLGTVRSARYPYVDIALGHDAVYLHHGQDPTYCAPHLNDIDHITIDTNNVTGKRISNGLATEHTLYAFGDKVWAEISKKFRTTTQKTSTWQKFAGEDEQLSFADGVANTINVPFQYSASFTYDATTGRYNRSTRGGARLDYVTKEQMSFKNVFILKTSIVNYPDGKHRKVYLDGGDGYYCVNGTYKPIRWTKGAASNGISMTETDGTPLTVNQGNSWVFIINSATTVPSFN